MKINDYLKISRTGINWYRDRFGEQLFYRNKAVICRDGFKISVQANENAYCEPMRNLANRYTSFELGYPSKPEPMIFDFAEDDDYTHTIYGMVPEHIVDEMLRKHGGIDVMKSIYGDKKGED